MATTIDAHLTSDAGTAVGASGSDQFTVEISDRADILFETEQAINQAKDQLPAYQAPGQINWLGSSYTGQDIKVVAHLYEAAKDQESPKLKRLKEEQEYFQALNQGAANLQTGLTEFALDTNTFQERVDTFDKMVGISTETIPSQRAKRDLFNQVLINTDFSSFIGVAKIRQSLDGTKTAAEQSLTSLENEIKRAEEVFRDGSSTIELGTLQTLSIQTHREKFGVRALGYSYVKGYTRGPRTLAGTMIFTVFKEHPLLKLIRALGEKEKGFKGAEISSLIPDQLPPIDLTIVFANEYGSLSRQNLYGVEFINDSVTFSIDNLLSEQVVNFVARDIDVMTDAGNIRLSRLQNGQTGDRDPTATDLLLGNKDYLRYLDVLKVRRRLVNR